jgi:pSer/pThr/pTyr-binding forkhead associated (FHA) protein
MAEAKLIVTKGELQGKEFYLTGVATIGRSEDNQIVLKEDIVSRQHVRIEIKDNIFFIYDLKSHNGIKVNDVAVTESRLKDGDLIQIGSTIFQFKLIQPDATMMLEAAPLKKIPLKTLAWIGGGFFLAVLLITVFQRSSGRIREETPRREVLLKVDQDKERLKRIKKMGEFASLEDLLKEAQKRLALGEQLYEEREITQGNLYRSVEYFKDVAAMTENIKPQPPTYLKAKENLKIAELELDRKFGDLRFMVEKYNRLKEWVRAMQAAETIMSMFPNPLDARYKYAKGHYVRLKRFIPTRRY